MAKESNGKKRRYSGYESAKVCFSDDLKVFVDYLDVCCGRGTTAKIARDICSKIVDSGYTRGYSTVRHDLDCYVCPSGLTDIYFEVFRNYGYNGDKPFYAKSDVVFVDKVVETEKVVEEQKPVYLTAPGEDWDSLALFKLISHISNSDFLYLQMLVGGNTSWFYEMEAKRLLQMKLITEDDIRKDNPSGNRRKRK